MDEFRLPILSPVPTFFVGAYVILAAIAWPILKPLAVILLLKGAVIALVFIGACRLRIRDDGLLVGWLHSLSWGEVVAVKRVSFLGLPYLVVTRQKGWRRWIPLFVKGPRSIETVLTQRVPVGNPLHTYAVHA